MWRMRHNFSKGKIEVDFMEQKDENARRLPQDRNMENKIKNPICVVSPTWRVPFRPMWDNRGREIIGGYIDPFLGYVYMVKGDEEIKEMKIGQRTKSDFG
jgi:hypothetical protein